MVNVLLSIIVPVYRNEESIPDLIAALAAINHRAKCDFNCSIEVVFVVDGSPDNSYSVLEQLLPSTPFASQLLQHSRNFGSFLAIRTGLQVATGQFFGVLAADLQEPPELLLVFLEKLLKNQCDVVIGCRERRNDPFISRGASNLFWKFYKTFVIHEIPEKGVDVFGCNKAFRNQLMLFAETHTSLVGLIFWLGFRRSEVTYVRRARSHGRSAWTFTAKFNYLLDSVFSFTDLPIKLLSEFGLIGVIASVLLGIAVILVKMFGDIPVPGYAATILTIVFFGGLNTLGLGIVGTYAWRAFENTKGRPLTVIMNEQKYNGTGC